MEAEIDAVVVHLEGEIDLVTTPILADTIAAAFRQRRRVIVDLLNVTFLDASGLGTLQQAARQYIGRFAVAVSNVRFRHLFEIAGLTDIVPLMVSVESGLEYLSRDG